MTSIAAVGAIALLLTGCPAATTPASLAENGSAAGNSASPQPAADLASSKTPSAPTESGSQTTESPTAATKSSTEENWAVQQAILNDPLLNAAIREEFERVPGRDPADIRPLQVGAIAIVENYALAEASGGVGDLPVIDGYYLLIRQNGRWIMLDGAGIAGEIVTDRMATLGVPEAMIQPLLNAFRQAGADFSIADFPMREPIMPCVTRLDDPNPPTNIRLAPGVASDNVIGQLPNGTALTVMEPLDGWLKIRQPLVGWVSMNLTRVSCGSSLAEVQRNLDELQAKEEELAVEAADTLVRYLYRGADGAFAEAAIARFNGFAIDKFYALEAALNRHTEEVRRQVLQQVIAPGMHPQARANFNEALLNRLDLSPTLKTWRSLNP
ncbi:SH3 domain-containing protein [Thermoleptolyngbya sp. C42_A2020_037]|uniref:SH3 domain-containing protein n=1 Tax=Thermoleptolyngbya sp. C42_A2020_037 TaxID=2747799 RepID=UPI0019DE353E|nr:SH3 domain-containing protein [Thermoleptolyngbya sp. C42_A2020_037]MBF2084759.1 SH3 domain-containing protein [Thermoleptolyngbya sp. C42_A2020_037]